MNINSQKDVLHGIEEEIKINVGDMYKMDEVVFDMEVFPNWWCMVYTNPDDMSKFFNNPDNMERAAVVTANRSIMARAGVCRSEIIMHEISHNLFKLMTPHQLDEATRLWHLASKIITPEDLEKAGATHDEAQRIYDYVFSDVTADSVQEFLSYALTNRFMIKALNSKNNKINAFLFYSSYNMTR